MRSVSKCIVQDVVIACHALPTLASRNVLNFITRAVCMMLKMLQALSTVSWEICYRENMDLHPNARSAEIARRSVPKAFQLEKNSRRLLPTLESENDLVLIEYELICMSTRPIS